MTDPPDDRPHAQMLRVVTKSFCREMVEYGVEPRELVRVSTHVLEFVMSEADRPTPGNDGPFSRLSLDDIRDRGDESYEMNGLSLAPLSQDHLELVQTWVRRDDIRTSMLVAYPTEADELRRHMAARGRAYHLIRVDGEPAGLIGAEHIDRHSRRMEMRKFIGEPSLRGRGIGTRATFVWLHHVFDILDFNKVYIHTHDTNVRNINLNRSLGFELEGVLSQERLLRGRYVDILRMGLLKKTWAGLTGSPEASDEG